MSRELAEINTDRAEARSKYSDLSGEAAGLTGRSSDDPGIAQRRERLATGIDRAKERMEALDTEAREALRELASNPANIESISGPDGVFSSGRETRTASGPTSAIRSRALRAVEQRGRTLAPEAADRLDRLIRDEDADPQALGARYVDSISSRDYASAFWKVLRSGPAAALLDLTREEAEAVRTVRRVDQERALAERAMSLTGAAGGFAVPFDLDPTIIGTSSGSLNPLRRISRIVTTSTDTWRGVTSGAITANYTAEAVETTDNSPVFAQPEISTERATAFVPFSIEIGQDWSSLQAELGQLLQEAKDDLEASKFTAGSGTNEPFGFITGATNTVNAAAGADTFTASNVYTLLEAVPPRYQPRTSIVASGAIINRLYRLTPSGSTTEPQLMAPDRGSILGRPVYELSTMPTTALTGNKFVVAGDFSRFVIVDRLGLQIETISHLFGVNRRPTGERGLWAMWRNSSKVIDSNAFRALLGTI